jgi:MFS family permease
MDDPPRQVTPRMKDAPEPAPSTARLFLSVFPSIMLPMFLAVVDQTIVSTALPAIAASLGHGGRRMMFVALGTFLAGSLLCAAAMSIEMLSFGRIVQGLGGGGLMTLSQALIGEAIPPRERARYQGYLAGVAVTSSTFGPVVGGLLTQHFGWRSIFLVNLPLGLVALLLTLRLEPRAGGREGWSFDGMGLVLFIAFITPVLLALQQAQRMSASALPSVLVLTGIGIAALVGLILRERRAATPLLPVHLLRQSTIWKSDALAACHGATLVSLITFTPIYLRVLRGTSASETGLLMLPLMFGIGAGSMVTGRVVSRTGRTAIYPSLGLIVVTMALVVLALRAGDLGTGQLSLYLFFTGLFMGTVMGVVQVTVQNVAGPESLGSAAASVQLSRSIGAAAGTALVGTVLFATLSLSDPATAALFATLVQQGPEAIAALPAPRRAMALAEIATAFRAAFLTMAAFAAIGLWLAWSIPTRRLS